MVLRIEDLDPDRCRQEYAEQLKRDLEWLGLDWDEEQTPQSQRTEAYCGGVLAAGGSEPRLPLLLQPRASCTRRRRPTPRTGRCSTPGPAANLTAAERAAKTQAPVPGACACRMETFRLQTVCRAHVRENLARGLRRFYPPPVATASMPISWPSWWTTRRAGVTEVVRGRDLLSSTPRQLWLQRQLGFPQPRLLPCAAARSRRTDGGSSKREQDLDLGALRQTLYARAAFGACWRVLCGILSHRPEASSAAELAREFSTGRRLQKENIVIANSV